jgi:hypothetical protein
MMGLIEIRVLSRITHDLNFSIKRPIKGKMMIACSRLLPLILITFCLICCTPALESPMPEPSYTPLPATNTPHVSFIEASPTPTVIVQTDDEVALSSSGPWLVYLTQEGIVAVNPDGSGRTLLGPPPLRRAAALTFDIPNGLSPRGNRLAFRADRADLSGLDLILARLPDGSFSALTPLISNELQSQGEANLDINIEKAVYWEADALRWSPDGRYLAFVAALDGPSSDLYVLDSFEETIRRLTTGENQAATPIWTQDGRWIIHQEVETFGSGAGWSAKAVWAAAVNGSRVRKLYDLPEYTGPDQPLGTTQTGELIVSRFSQMNPTLHLVEIASGALTVLAEGFPTADIVAFDPVSGAVAYITDGLYLRRPGESSAMIVADGFWHNVLWSPGFDRFFAEGDAGVTAFTQTGESEQTISAGSSTSPSPDGSWLITCVRDMQLYDREWNLMREFPGVSCSGAVWRPDSQGLFYIQGEDLYYLVIPDGMSLLVESNVMVTYDYPSRALRNLGWVGR